MEVHTTLKANMEQLRRGRDTSLPNNPRKASEIVCLQFTRALVKLHEFYIDPVIQERHARRFMETPKYEESDAPTPPPFDNGMSSSVAPSRDVIVIPSSSPVTSFEDDDPDEIDGYEQDMMGTEEEEIDEEDAFRILTQSLRSGLRRSTTTEEGDVQIDAADENNEKTIEALDSEDEGVQADEESLGEDEEDDDEDDCILLTSEDQPRHDPQPLSSQSENDEEEYRGRSRYRKRLNGHSDRSSVSSFEVRPPLRKKPKVVGAVDSDELMADESRNKISLSEEELQEEQLELRREQLADELMLPPLTRISGRLLGN